MHVQQKMYCMKANRQECEQRPDWCNSTGGIPNCGGLANCELCSLNTKTQKCEVRESTRTKCSQESLIKDGKIITEKQPDWKYKNLSSKAKELIGKKLTRKDIVSLKIEDRTKICGAFLQEACDLIWNEASAQGTCEIQEESCARCVVQTNEHHCSAKNLCNGLICL